MMTLRISFIFTVIFLIHLIEPLAQSQNALEPTELQLLEQGLSTNTGSDPKITEQLSNRDPFSPPQYIRDMERVNPEDIIDNRMEAIRRWPLSDYKLKGIIWDVKNPKAMIVDKMNTLHLLKKNYRIGHREGLISEINESEIIILQKGVPVVMQIEKEIAGQYKQPELSTINSASPSTADQNIIPKGIK